MRFIYSSAFRIGFSVFVGLALLVIFDAQGYLGLIYDGFSRFYGFSQRRAGTVVDTTKEYFHTLFTIRGLVDENAKLTQQIRDLSFDNARLQASKEENTALRRSLNFAQSSMFATVPVEVIAADPTGFTQVVTINKGLDEEIKINSPVITAPGLLIGKVTKLNPHSADVTLITDPSIRVNAEVSDTSARGLVVGEHGLGLLFDLVSQNEVIKTQDAVITSGLSQDFPRGLLIGRIDSITSSSSDLFQKAFVSPAANLRNLRFLFVIKS